MNELFKTEYFPSSGVGLVSIKDIKSNSVILTQNPVISVSFDGNITFYCLKEEIKVSQYDLKSIRICCNEHLKFFNVLQHITQRASTMKAKTGPCLIITLYLIVSNYDLNIWSSTNFEYISKDQGAFSLSNIARNALLFIGIEKSINDILRVITSISENSFTINTSDGNIIALYDHPITKVNHSCNPNCIVKYSGNIISMESLRDIKQGKQLLISYIDNQQSREDRKKILLDQYGFECKCVFCYGVKAEYREAALRFNFCPNSECQNSARESFAKFIKLPLDDDRVDCKVSFISVNESMLKSVADRLGLLSIEGDYLRCWRCNELWNKSPLIEMESLLVDGVGKETIYESLKYIKNWIDGSNLKFRYWLDKLNDCTI